MFLDLTEGRLILMAFSIYSDPRSFHIVMPPPRAPLVVRGAPGPPVRLICPQIPTHSCSLVRIREGASNGKGRLNEAYERGKRIRLAAT